MRRLKELFTRLFGKPEINESEIKLKALHAEISRLDEIANNMPVRYVEVTRFEDTNETYVREIANIGSNEHFRFFLYDIRESIVDQLEKAAPDAVELRAQLVGELKGINIVRRLLENKIESYLAVKK